MEFEFSKEIPEGANIVATCIFKPTHSYRKISVYVSGMVKTAFDLPHKLPGWYHRIYYDDSFANDQQFQDAFDQISGLSHVQFVKFRFDQFRDVDQQWGHIGMFGSFVRFHAMFDTRVSHVLFRNVNHILMEHEPERILEWVNSDNNYLFYANEFYTWDPDMYFPYNCREEDEVNYSNRFTRAGGMFDHFTDIIKYKSYKRPADYPVITRVLAGLFGSKANRPIEHWNYMIDMLKTMQSKPEFSDFAYGTDEIVVTSMFYNFGVLGSTMRENNNYLIRIDNQEYRFINVIVGILDKFGLNSHSFDKVDQINRKWDKPTFDVKYRKNYRRYYQDVYNFWLNNFHRIKMIIFNTTIDKLFDAYMVNYIFDETARIFLYRCLKKNGKARLRHYVELSALYSNGLQVFTRNMEEHMKSFYLWELYYH